jgi:tripartite-type tricarboxylate transporter receptor subunit TctC
VTRILNRRSLLAGLAATGATVSLAARAGTAEWKPTSTVRIVVPFSAGAISDTLARLIAVHLQARWGQPVIVENRTGAGGTIGTIEVARSKPDGLTLLLGSTAPQSMAYSLFRGMQYKPDDLTPISNVITGGDILMVNKSVPANSLIEFVDWLQKNDGVVNYASAGVGSIAHLAGSWFFKLIDVKATHVPYRGSAPAIIDLISGTVQVFFDNISNGIEFVRKGQVKGFGITTPGSNPYTDLPVMCQSVPALSKFVIDTFYGVFGPANLPTPIVNEVNTSIKEFLSLPTMPKHLENWAAIPAWASPKETDDYLRADIAKWRSLLDAENIKLDIG